MHIQSARTKTFEGQLGWVLASGGNKYLKNKWPNLTPWRIFFSSKPTENKIFTDCGDWEFTFRSRKVRMKKTWLKKRKKVTLMGLTKVVLFLRCVPLFSVSYGVYTTGSTSRHLIPPDLFLCDIRLDKFHNILAPTVRGQSDKTHSAPFHQPLLVSWGRRGKERRKMGFWSWKSLMLSR